MRIPHLRSAAVIVAAGIGLGGCATYSPYGYGSGLSVSIGSGYGGYGRYGGYGYHDPFYDPFYDPYYMGYRSYRGSRYGGYYGSPYGGWYNGFYYPGIGIYVYDRHRQRSVWNDSLRNYWGSRGARLEASGVTNPAVTNSKTVRRTDVVRERPTRNRLVRVERSRPQAVERTSRRTSVERSARQETVERTRAARAEQRAERAERLAEQRAERRAERAAAKRLNRRTNPDDE